MSVSAQSHNRRPSITSNASGLSERTPLLPGASSISIVKDDPDLLAHPPHGWPAEVRALTRVAFPLWMTFLLEYAIGGFTIAFVGHLGVKEMNAASLGQLLLTTTTVAPLIYGLCAALDTLATQAFTSPNPKNTSLYVLRTGVIIFASLVPASIFLWFGESILLFLKQDPDVARLAGEYVRVYLAGVPLLAAYELCRRWLQVQNLIFIPTLVLVVAAPLSIILNYLLVLGPDSMRIGFIGSAIAVVITDAVMLIMLVVYIVGWAPRHAWGGWTSAIFLDLGPNIRLGLAGIASVCSEWLSWDVVSIASSLVGPEPFAANQILIVFAVTAYQLPFALSVAASIRIGNLVGAQQIRQAKISAQVIRWSTVVLGLLNSVIAIGARNQISQLFTEDLAVMRLVSSVMPLVAAFQVLDGLTGTCQGILRGVGLAGISAKANIIGYWIFGIPTGLLLAFHYGFGLKGLWCGHVLALSLTTLLVGTPTYSINWQRAADDAKKQSLETEAFLHARRRTYGADVEDNEEAVTDPA